MYSTTLQLIQQAASVSVLHFLKLQLDPTLIKEFLCSEMEQKESLIRLFINLVMDLLSYYTKLMEMPKELPVNCI